MLTQRLVGAAIIGIVVAVPFYFGGVLFAALTTILAMAAAIELHRMFLHLGYHSLYVVSVGLTGLIVISSRFAPGLVGVGIVLGVLGSLAWIMFRATDFEHSVLDWAITIVPPLYLGWTLSYFPLLRDIPGNAGLIGAGLALLGTWAADTGAYFTGRSLGRHKLWPRVSPGKTWEGVAGGALLSAAALTLLLFLAQTYGWISTPASIVPLWVHGIPLGFLVAIVAVLGDLCESFLKRATGVKDASHLIPGHGGILDRLDSLVFCVPLVYYYLGWFIPFQ